MAGPDSYTNNITGDICAITNWDLKKMLCLVVLLHQKDVLSP